MPKQKISITLDNDIIEAVDALVEVTGQPRSATINKLIELGMEPYRHNMVKAIRGLVDEK
ncbi:MAG: ribbon-helix-helix protein, CopG family [Leuconostoc mesenteroides]